MKEKFKIKMPSDIYSLMKKYGRRKEENFYTITLNAGHEVIKVHHITKGLVNRTIIHPRECFFPAIKDYASAIIICHNHPSGSLEPSPEDQNMTDRMSLAAHILGFTFLDSCIITKDSYHSSRQDGMIKEYSDKALDEYQYYSIKSI